MANSNTTEKMTFEGSKSLVLTSFSRIEAHKLEATLQDKLSSQRNSHQCRQIINTRENICKSGEMSFKNVGKSSSSSLKSKNVKASISKQFQKITKINPKIISFMKNIAKEIKFDILGQQKPANSILDPPSTKDDIAKEPQIIRAKIKKSPIKTINDKFMIQQNDLTSLLVPMKVDNDVQSQDEDLNMGVQYLYGQLLYSVGEQMMQKKLKMKRPKVHLDNNKENNYPKINELIKNQQQKPNNQNYRNKINKNWHLNHN